jgi:hypothetical protein
MIFTDYRATAAANAFCPILGAVFFIEFIKLPDAFQSFVNELPRARLIRPHFTSIFT